MRVAVLFEESGYIRSEFLRFGHDAYSVDLEPPADRSTMHFRMDVDKFLDQFHEVDLIIAHPPCTHMAVSGNRHWAGTQERADAIVRTRAWWKRCKELAPRVCFEQPVSVLTLPESMTQQVTPAMFGCAEKKRTVLHLHGLPPLERTHHFPEQYCNDTVHKMPPSDDRSRKRGHLPWLARPMAEQWGKL